MFYSSPVQVSIYLAYWMSNIYLGSHREILFSKANTRKLLSFFAIYVALDVFRITQGLTDGFQFVDAIYAIILFNYLGLYAQANI
jgi:hypothetical protein